jgi:hypothetical protein
MFGLFQKKALTERLKDAEAKYMSERYKYGLDSNPLDSQTKFAASMAVSRVIEQLEAGAPVRETLVSNFQSEMLRMLLNAAGERAPSRNEYGRDK